MVIKGSSLTFYAQEGRGKEKTISTKNPFAEARTARQEEIRYEKKSINFLWINILGSVFHHHPDDIN